MPYPVPKNTTLLGLAAPAALLAAAAVLDEQVKSLTLGDSQFDVLARAYTDQVSCFQCDSKLLQQRPTRSLQKRARASVARLLALSPAPRLPFPSLSRFLSARSPFSRSFSNFDNDKGLTLSPSPTLFTTTSTTTMFSKLFIALTLAAAASASCVHGTSLHRRQEGGAVEVSNFGYSGERGPLNWAGLDPANVACRNSKVQSPIVLDDTVSRAASVPQITINPVAEAEFENLGTTLETIVSGTTVFEGATFELKQFHLHTPSEHRINEEYFPLEMHMVHEGADGSIAVIAIPFQLTEDGTTTALLTSVIENIAQVTTPGTATKTGALDFTELIAAVQAGPLFQYQGSLTTPPCAEGLTFLVLEKPLALDVRTFNTLKSVIKFNARYSQNTLGQTNLLDVAVALAVRDDGINVAGGAVAQNNNTEIICAAQQQNGQHQVQITSDVDVQALVRELVNAGQEIRLETVTTSTTHVLPAGANHNANQNDRNNNDRERQRQQEEQQRQREQQRQQEQQRKDKERMENERERVVIVPQTNQQHGQQQQGKVVVVQQGQPATSAGHVNVKIARDAAPRRRRGLNFSSWAKDKRRL